MGDRIWCADWFADPRLPTPNNERHATRAKSRTAGQAWFPPLQHASDVDVPGTSLLGAYVDRRLANGLLTGLGWSVPRGSRAKVLFGARRQSWLPRALHPRLEL